ncbi:MAG: amino acid ABC transporter permease [Chloroflexota bacterium]|nr:amino acid ABC transporter permease [Chloroflexota bacterium]
MTTVTATSQSTLAERVAWAKANLFNSRGNSVLTVVSLGTAALLIFLAVRYVLFQANWGLVAINRRLFFIGSYPPDETLRIWIAIFLVVGLISITYGIWSGRLRPYLMVIGVIAAIVLTLGLGTDVRIEAREFTDVIQAGEQTTTVSGINNVLVMEQGWAPSWLYAISLGLAVPFGSTWLLMAAVFATLAAGAWVGQRIAPWRSNPIMLQGLGALWVLLIPTIVLLQIGVSSNSWESAFLDVLVFVVGGFFSFFIGLALALGRISPYASIRVASVGYIEVVRAAPLLVWLLFATFLQDELGPIGESFSSIDLVYRVMIVFAFFGGAYIAEVIRGGLQSVPRGQWEASQSLGLSSMQMYALIVLPQAIRAVIPAIIGRFIALWKDTALLAAISLVNTLEKSKKILSGQTDIAEGAFFEVYIVVGLIYWAVSYMLSRLGGAAEARLGVGQRR